MLRSRRSCRLALAVGVGLLGAPSAWATECGEARLQAAQLKAALTVEEGGREPSEAAAKARRAAGLKDLRTVIAAADKRLAQTCAPLRTTIAALPLAYVTLPPGAASSTVIEPGERWALTLTTQAGAGAGIVFADPILVTLPPGSRFEAVARADEEVGGAWVLIAVDAVLTVEEPAPGRGSMRIELKGAPVLAPLARLRACADGGGGKLPASTCRLLTQVVPSTAVDGLPERGRATLLGEWQYGDRISLEIGPELGELPVGGPPPRLDLVLDLAAPLPGISDGNRLSLSAAANRQAGLEGGRFKLSQGCPADGGCPDSWMATELWFDRVFAVPFHRRRTLPAAMPRVSGAITDRLGAIIPGQRVLAERGDRRVYTLTDADGRYRVEGLGHGESSVAAVGKKLTVKPRIDYVRRFSTGLAPPVVPTLLMDRRFE